MFLQIKIDSRFKEDTHEDCLLSVDGVDFEIEEPYPYVRNISNVWYSHKFKGPGLRYEIAIAIKSGDIAWLNGPYPCGKHNDLALFKKSLCTFLEEGERVEADDGYRGKDPDLIKSKTGLSSRYSSKEQKNAKYSKSEARNC